MTVGASTTFAAAMFVGALRVTLPHAPPLAAYADGAPPGFSGGFKESSCDACHFETPVNTPPGQIAVTGIPERFAPGQRYALTVTLTRPGFTVGGFQLTARFEDGTQAGTLERAPGDEKRLAIETTGGIQYANQKLPGAKPAQPGAATWTVVWTAPATPAAVVFHVAANAADGDESVRGDYIYTATLRSLP